MTNNMKCICTAICPKDKSADNRVCDFSYLESVFASDLSDYEKFIFCKHYSEPSFRHGWLISFRKTIISDEEYHALQTLAERHFIEPSFRHGWLISFRKTIISDEEYHALQTLAERHFIELRDDGNGFIAIGRPIWPELYCEDLPDDA